MMMMMFWCYGIVASKIIPPKMDGCICYHLMYVVHPTICNGSVACEISTETHQLSYIFARDAQPLPTWSLLDASKPGKGIRMVY
jgi:hypothetical protein